MHLTFEWDQRKATANARMHAVSFEEGATAFADPLSITVDDPDHSTPNDQRYILLGMSHRNRLLVVIHVERGDNLRIVSARLATRHERKTYEEG